MPDFSPDSDKSAADWTNQAEALLKALCADELDPLFWRSDLTDVESAWHGHVPFAHWVVGALAPRCIVELGSHNGVSYAAFCRAVQREGLATRCFAVDTWTGDAHAGFYQEDVFTALRGYHDQRFGAFSTLIRGTFDDALDFLPDGSVDLLHIDGRHGYEDVRHDFESWRGKMSSRGVVLLHDTNVRDNGFGVWRLWAELQRDFPSFEFLHNHGLGVVAVGLECPPALAALAELTDQRAVGAVRDRFAQLGERCVLQAQVNLLGRMVGRLTTAETELATTHADLQKVRAARDAAQQAQVEAERGRLAAQGEAERSRLAAQAREQQQRNVLLAEMQRRETVEVVQVQERPLVSVILWAARPLLVVLSLLPDGLRRLVLGALLSVWLPLRGYLDRPRQPVEAAGPPESPQRQALDQTVTPLPRAGLLEPVVCYLSGEPETPGTTYRVQRYAAACGAAGARVTVLRADEAEARMAEADGIDFLVIWRAAWTDTLAAFVSRARLHGARIAFDVDDLMIDPVIATTEIIDGIRSQNFSEAEVQAHFGRMQRTMLEADVCCAPTSELVGHMRRFAKPGFLLPNGFDKETLRASRLAARRRLAAPGDGLLRLGYASGSRTHQRDFAVVASALPGLFQAHPDCRLVLFQANDVKLVDVGEFPALRPFADRIEWRQMVALDKLPEEIARFDVNLAPLQLDNPFCAAKSELKYFEAALAGACTVASPVGPYARVIRHGCNGFLAATPAQWAAALTQLLTYPTQRRQVAQTALNDVLWTYGPERRTQLMRRVLTEWQGGAAAADAFVLELSHRSGTPPGMPAIPAGEVVFSVDHLRDADVTVAVPLYNYANLVTETLESVRAQTLRQLDLVIVDDMSTDDSLATTLAWARDNADRFNRLAVIRNERNAGLGLTRNVAFSAAETPYVLPLDADNLLRPGCCELLLAAIEQSGAAFAYPVIQEFGDRTGLIGAAPYDPSRFVGGNYIDAMALIAKSAWCAAGGYAPMRMGWEDYDFWCAVAEAGLHGFAMGGQPLADYRAHASSMLAQVTDTQDEKCRVIATIERRHPWVSVARPLQLGTPAANIPR